ncbi:hypothetical protein D1007_20689 [Hordeum vulgare]|nr:hypothetical protein D1007_20689 [Hordeum vulgare]
MASLSEANFVASGGAAVTTPQDLEDFFDQLDLNEEEFNDVEIDKEDQGIQDNIWWLALARVHIEKNFSQASFYRDMREAWNLAQGVRFRPVGPNRFVVQASCLGETEEVKVDLMPIWLQIHKLRNPFCKEGIVTKLLKAAGDILEMRLTVRAMERQIYLVRYEKLARFCKLYGLIGHEHKECGLGVHDEKKLKFGDWLYADGPNMPRAGPNSGRASGPRQPVKHGAPASPMTLGSSSGDPDTADTASSPMKSHPVVMEVDKDARKRLNMDTTELVSPAIANKSWSILAITDGSEKV